MYYIDTDVLIHSMVNQNSTLHLKANDLIEDKITKNKFLISRLSIQELGFVLAKLDQQVSFITSKLESLISADPVPCGITEFSRALELAKVIGFIDFNDCLHTAIAEQHCTDLFTCNYKDFKRIEYYTTLKIHFVK